MVRQAANKPTKTEKLRKQMEEIKSKLKEAEEEEKNNRLKEIEKSIRRSGILKYDVPLEKIENALKALIP